MKKLNRRDYLKSMGMTAGVIAGATELDVFAQPNQTVPTTSTSTQKGMKKDTSRVFVQTAASLFDLRPTESVKLVFYGLMALWRNADEHCLIGFHSKATSKHKHRLMIKAFRKVGDTCEQMGDTVMVPQGANMDLEISRPDVLDGVYFFQPPLTNGHLHDSDFRWVVNLEGPSWYNQILPRKVVHNPILKVRNGLFHTLMKTESTFRRQKTEGDVLHIGSIANYVATNIYLEAGGQVSLSLPGRTITCPQAENVRYELQFINHCEKSGTSRACEFKPYHLTDKTERSDFYMHFEGIDLPLNREYELIVAQGATGYAPPICREARASDESPCSVVGYGGTEGFPAFP